MDDQYERLQAVRAEWRELVRRQNRVGPVSALWWYLSMELWRTEVEELALSGLPTGDALQGYCNARVWYQRACAVEAQL